MANWNSNIYLSDPDSALVRQRKIAGIAAPQKDHWDIKRKSRIDPIILPPAGSSASVMSALQDSSPTARPAAQREKHINTANGMGYGRKHHNYYFYMGHKWDLPASKEQQQPAVPWNQLPIPSENRATKESWGRFENRNRTRELYNRPNMQQNPNFIPNVPPPLLKIAHRYVLDPKGGHMSVQPESAPVSQPSMRPVVPASPTDLGPINPRPSSGVLLSQRNTGQFNGSQTLPQRSYNRVYSQGAVASY